MTFCSLGLVNGCGSGYHVIAATSGTAVTMNAGQTVQVPQAVPASAKWVLTGTGCSSTSCGTVVPSNDSVLYTAPPTVASQIHVIAATEDTIGKFEVTVNPELTLTATLNDASVDTPYTATVSTNGGSNPARLSLASGSLPTGLQFNASSGMVSGTPKVDGDYPVTFQATDASAAATATALHRTLRVRHRASNSSVTITTSSLPAGTVNTAYSAQVQAGGGTTPYTWSITSGSLPTGLALSRNGVLSGTPTSPGTASFAVQVADSNGASTSASLMLSILTNNTSPTPTTLSITAPAAGTVGTAYTGIIGVSGGAAPYVCSVTSGSLPAGLSLSGCSLTGTPTTAGSYSLTVKATDSSSSANSSTANITIIIGTTATPAKLAIGAPSAATVGTIYSSAIAVSGGTGPYTCSITSGTLPAGIARNNCALTGTPTASGTFALGIKATDSSNPVNSGSATVSLAVNATASQLSLTAPPVATVGKTYSGNIGVSGGTAPYTCSLASGTLPAGLKLNNCTLTGTPTTAGSSALSIKATDSGSTIASTTANVVVTVNTAATTLTLSSPAAATVGIAYTGTIGVSGGTAPYTCALASGTLPAGLTLNNCTLTGTPTTAGSSTLSIKATDSSSPANVTTANVTVVVNSASSTTPAGAPHINYTDLNVGSGTGGDNGNGVYVRIFGSHFGSSQGSSSVTLGAPLVTSCTLCSWSDTQIIAQLGSSATTGQIVATVNGLQSNGVPFTVTPTTIVFVSPNGSDSNSGSFTSPFKTWRAAFNSVTSNDSKSPSQNTVIYLEPGTDVTFDDGRGYKAAISTDIGGTSTTNQLSIVGYPGGTVNVGSSSITNGVHGWGKFITIANLNIVGQSSAIDAEAGNTRIINNSFSCPAPPSGLGGTACVLGETTDPTETWVFQGNNVHDTGGNVDKTYHAVYFSSNVNHADVGWNNVGQNFKGYCRGIMFHATLGSNQFDLHIHDNIVTNSYCDGIGLASVDPSKGTVEIYNNVVAHAALATNPYGVANEAGIAINSDPAGSSSGNVEVYNNTVVDAGAYLIGNQNGCFGVVTSGAGIHLTNNICYQPLPTQPYIEKGSTNVSGSNNLWFGAGAAPTWDSAPLTSDPLFLSTSIFSLQSQSPASGNGTTSIMSPFDILGVPRGSRPSLGAYQ
ncbi:beta strand repeat-containing protein [Terriglobus sp. RCC_193]|uniref:beta strand repeat-containing protein n=1 Tax=Terriglobus sp. RCC_193 TaxID=3239218 RepID=UPI003523D0F3